MQPLDIGVSAISAGTTQAFGGQVVFSDSHNITFGVNGHTVTASVAAGGVTVVSGLGVSTGGNTSGMTGTVVGTVVLAAINNITLSQATAAGPIATVTISGRDAIFGAGVSTGGNTTGTTGTVTGTLVLAGIGNVTLSQSTNASGATITISGGSNSSASVVSAIGVSTGGNTAGNTGTTQGTYILAGGNNITLSQSTAAGSLATVTISGRDAIFGAGVSTGGNTTGTTGTVTGTLVFAGIGNITLSQSTNGAGATITASVGTAATTGVQAIAAGTQTATSGTVVFSNNNVMIFAMSNNSVVTARPTFMRMFQLMGA